MSDPQQTLADLMSDLSQALTDLSDKMSHLTLALENNLLASDDGSADNHLSTRALIEKAKNIS